MFSDRMIADSNGKIKKGKLLSSFFTDTSEKTGTVFDSRTVLIGDDVMAKEKILWEPRLFVGHV